MPEYRPPLCRAVSSFQMHAGCPLKTGALTGIADHWRINRMSRPRHYILTFMSEAAPCSAVNGKPELPGKCVPKLELGTEGEGVKG